MSRVIRNNKAYDSGDAEAFINGVPTEVSEISYNVEQEHQLNHTLKNDANSWSMGKKTPTCTVTIPMHVASKIEKGANGNLLGVKPFDINVTFSNDYNEVVNDTILCKFQNQGREVTGDMGLEKQYTMFVLDIDFNNN